MDTLTSLRVFCAVAEHRNFTTAAGRLGLSPAMASKHVMHLEARLGIRLLNRTSRKVSLTESGALYLQQVKPMLDGLEEVEAAIANISVVPRGTLRFTAPVWFASARFSKMISAFSRRHPDVGFDIDLSGRLVNLVEEGYDLALRATDPTSLDPGLVARKLGDITFHLVAARGYLDRAGRPSLIGDLTDHAFLRYSGIRNPGGLIFEGPDGPQTVSLTPVMESANETMLRLAALEGMGLVLLPCWMIEQDLADGRFELVLPDVAKLGTELFAIYPSRKYLSAKVRVFIDFLATDLSNAAL